MEYKISSLYEDQAEKLNIIPRKEIYKKRTKEYYLEEFNNHKDFYVRRGYKSGEDYFNFLRENCGRDKKFFDVCGDSITQYWYNYYVDINSLDDLYRLQEILGGFYISTKERIISVNEE